MIKVKKPKAKDRRLSDQLLSYELRTPADWDELRKMYETLTQDPRIKLASFKELVS